MSVEVTQDDGVILGLEESGKGGGVRWDVNVQFVELHQQHQRRSAWGGSFLWPLAACGMEQCPYSIVEFKR